MLEYIIYPLYFIFGAVFGSFINVVICRVPNDLSIINPPSHCFGCGKHIRWYDNIPIISYIVLRGKCRNCGTKISIRDFLVEIVNSVLWLLIAVMFFEQNVLFSILLCFAVSILIIIGCIDYDHMYVPDLFVIMLAAIGLVIMIFSPAEGFVWGHLIGAAIGGGFLLLVFGIGYLIKKKPVVGFGDIKLMAACGLLLSWKAICVAYLFGIIAALVGIIVKAMLKKDLNKQFPFAPYLVFGVIVAMFFGQTIMNAYLGLF